MNFHSNKPSTPRPRRGMTLLEVVIALGMMSIIIGMIYRVANTSIKLSQSVVTSQNETMERNAFFNMLKNHFEQIPGNAVVRLDSFEASRNRQLFTLTFQNVPMAFNWGEVPVTAEAVELATIEKRDGLIDVVLRIYDEKILEDSDSSGQNFDIEPIAEIILLENLFLCDCECVDGRSLDIDTSWDNNGQMPLYIKFYCRFEQDSDIVQQTFWIVPKQNPQVVMRQIIQQNPGGPAATEGGDSAPAITLPSNNTSRGGGGTRPPTPGQGSGTGSGTPNGRGGTPAQPPAGGR